ncbi:uncharacterized protein DUF262 [Rivibacter subsaxonicus]|uniref:Uncharacterized protein DUF262 n=1 Tax=Rivibacter subsaxonicus TaxID=457575 RepID=A0A4Q7W263_9BURK|nr:uncharacterized protein DUF262 [Rivibacter subsaxonicus]
MPAPAPASAIAAPVAQSDEAVPEPTVFDPIDDEQEVPSHYSITAYGADYPVDGLVKRLGSGDIFVPSFDPETPVDDETPGFQRRFVWLKAQCDRFIDSLLLGFPVPGIFLVKQNDGRHIVLDGQQRLKTLEAFYKGVIRGKEFVLERVQEKYRGRTYATLDAEDRRRLDDSIIHATIIRQDEPTDDQSSIYLIFERLNTGGTTLQPQEIRAALFQHGLIPFIRGLNANENWRALYGRTSPRLKDQELILRFFALLYMRAEYKRPMKDFLNRYAESNGRFQLQSQAQMTGVFEATVQSLAAALGPTAFRFNSALNAAVADSIMVAVAECASRGEVLTAAQLQSAHASLLADESYLDQVSRSTADEDRVLSRIAIAVKKFTAV